MSGTSSHRPIRSFVRREGRLTRGQQRALDTLWPRFGVDTPGVEVLEADRRALNPVPLDLAALFGRATPGDRVLEIGFGNGASLAEMAATHPGNDYLGIEVHRPGVGNLLRLLGEQDLKNVRVICDDAVQVLKYHLPDASLDRVQLYFPDPWHKKRHHKRRIATPAFAALVAQKLKPGGVFHLATDWRDYAEQMLTVMEAASAYRNLAGTGEYSPRPDWRPLTKFEQRGQRLGHGVWDLLFERLPG
ncbi:MAG TPA: tRNA (guanosine(46)-N7)-methyltransferase TrmB [Gammaproteobacteria bacterium]|nr:tRNA (guanosine(46)-N7)-methyltransferase TrmB [Gammaproteobacteria bacterium]